MASRSTLVTVALAQVAPSAEVTNYLSNITGVPMAASEIRLPKQGIFSPPMAAASFVILTPDAFFFEPGLTQPSERTLQRRDEIKFLPNDNSTLGVYAYQSDVAVVRVNYVD